MSDTTMDKFFEFQNHIDKIYIHSLQVDDDLFDLFRCTSFYLDPHLIDSFFGQKVVAKSIDLKYLRILLVKLRITLVAITKCEPYIEQIFYNKTKSATFNIL